MGDQNITSHEPPQNWEQLYIEYASLLYNYGCKITSQKSLIEDCVHDVFVNLLKAPQCATTINNPKAYLFKSFRRLLINKLKTDTRSQELVLDRGGEAYQFNIELSSEAYRIIEENNDEQRKKIAEAIRQLSPRQKEAIYLKFYENQSYEEVAGIMKIEKSALYSMIYKSLAQLRRALSPILSTKTSAGYYFSLFASGLLLLV
ncbi:RNA polymerase sigma factor (sigma-70 family) [Catalinimonas alkaloidigena]|uniref:RNA polymerase sigma factor n=1 Tax=Catalinimonas alkaloidigena TaxID=1075417 RepID=UPI0024058562|nr:sigma-70 family RNA polymerase sigma factor [Catalinimonas alkaloidigena]MDF9794926.1 RNA polymerase sigma factor (sigma-70 family) [Catalinimonas alkaloidigena]